METWDSRSDFYTPAEIRVVLEGLGIEIVSETTNDFLSYCPFHSNDNSPAFSTSKTKGYSVCFNPSCGVGYRPRLTLEKLVEAIRGGSKMAIKGFISRAQSESSLEDKFMSIDDIKLEPFPQQAIDTMKNRLWSTHEGLDYLHGRGFEDSTIDYFNMGLAKKSRGPIKRPVDMVVVPAYDHTGMPVGVVGRSIQDKIFRNYGANPDGTGFHKSKIVMNLHNAKRHDTVIITEASFDMARCHQAGYHNVVALLGGSLSTEQASLLSKFFDTIIIATDNETKRNGGLITKDNCGRCARAGRKMCQGHSPGRDLGMKIVNALSHKRIRWASYDDRFVYKDDVKDLSMMDDVDIARCMRNSVGHFEYIDWMGSDLV